MTVDEILTEDREIGLLVEEQTPVPPKLKDALNAQLNQEFANFYLYHHFANVMDSMGFKGFEKFFRSQASGEQTHAMLFNGYLLDRNLVPSLKPIQNPTKTPESVRQAVELALEREKQTTKEIWAIQYLADETKDAATHQWIKFLVDEQVEEEKTTQDLLTRIQAIGDDRAGLLLIDGDFGNFLY